MLQTDQPVLPDSIPSPSLVAGDLTNMSIDEFLTKIVNSMVTFAINLAIAIVVFYVGKFIIKKLYNIVLSILHRRNVDASLSTFVLSMVRIVLYFILIVTVIGILGIETSSFIAIFASAGVAIGMALSGTLQNFAGGVLILLLKPYKVGDYIEAGGFAGTVREIQIFHTLITTPDNKAIIIPNGGLSTGSINNYSREEYRRVDWTVSIAYGDDFDTARKKILEILDSDERSVKKYIETDRELRAVRAAKEELEKIAPQQTDDAPAESHSTPGTEDVAHGIFGKLKARHLAAIERRRLEELREVASEDLDPEDKPKVIPPLPMVDRSPSVVLAELGASSVDLKVRAWTHNSQYWDVFYEMNARIYAELGQAGISFPFPQMDVHIINPDK